MTCPAIDLANRCSAKAATRCAKELSMLALDIANLSETAIKAAVADHCRRLGTVKSVTVHLPANRFGFAFALVEMSCAEETDHVLIRVGDSEFISTVVIWLEQVKAPVPVAHDRGPGFAAGPSRQGAQSNAPRVNDTLAAQSRRQKSIDILLVEDDPADVRMTREALKAAGVPHTLHVAEDGLEAISFLHRTRQFDNAPQPDIVLLDLNIPKLNGHTVLSEIKCTDRLKQIPVVVLTCSKSDSDKQKSRMMKADYFMTKATGLEAYVEQIKSIAAIAMH
jgi:CheY-like chemotaxis protein